MDKDFLSLEDFCKAIEFIAPEGTSIDFFIAPKDEDEDSIIESFAPSEMSYVEEVAENPNSSVVYIKKDLADIQNDASGVMSPITLAGEPVVNRKKVIKTTDDPLFTQGGSVPVAKRAFVLAEGAIRKIGNSIVLLEDICQFKKGTLIKFRGK